MPKEKGTGWGDTTLGVPSPPTLSGPSVLLSPTRGVGLAALPPPPVSHRAAPQLPVPYLGVPCLLRGGGPTVSPCLGVAHPLPGRVPSPLPGSPCLIPGWLCSPYPITWGGPMSHIGVSPVPSWGAGFPIPRLGWSLPEVAPVPYLGGSYLAGEVPCPGGSPARRWPCSPLGVTLSPSLSPTWGAGAGPSVHSAGAAGAAGRQSRPASPPLPPSSSSSTSLPPPPCLPHRPGRRQRGACVLRVPHASRLPHAPQSAPWVPRLSSGCPTYPGVIHSPAGALICSEITASQVFPWTPPRAPHTLRAPSLPVCPVSPPYMPGLPVYPKHSKIHPE